MTPTTALLLVYALSCTAASWLLLAWFNPRHTGAAGAPRAPPSSARRYRTDLLVRPATVIPSIFPATLTEPTAATAATVAATEAVSPGRNVDTRMTAWYTSAGEVFTEGARDAEEQRAVRELMRPGVHIAAADVVKITLSGRIPEILGLDEIVLQPPSARARAVDVLIGGKAYFTSGGGHGGEFYHLGRSREIGDPFWYLSKGGPVRAKHDPKPQVNIVAYASAPDGQQNMAVANQLEPWQPGASFEWWAKPHGHWQKFGPEEFYLLPHKIL